MSQENGILNMDNFINSSVYKKTFCDTISSFTVRDTWPTGIAWDGQYLWSCGSEFEYIYKYDTAGILIDSIPNPSPINTYGTQGIVFKDNHLWTLDETEDVIYELDTITGFIVNQFNIPANKNGFGLTFDGIYLWAGEYINGILWKIEPSNGQIVNTIYTEKPILGLDFINGSLYGISTDYTNLYKIDTVNGNFIDNIPWCIPYPLGICWDGFYLWNISSKILYGGNQKAYKIDLGGFITGSTNNILTQNNLGLTVFPNPIIESGIIKFNTKKTEFVTIELFGYDGRKIKTLMNKEVLFGKHSINLHTNELSSGIYFIKMSSMNDINTFKFIVTKE
jgi:hypothetical protein